MLIADGGGGGSISDIVNPLSSGAMGAAVQAAKEQTDRLVAAAASGGFRITAEGVKPLRDALTALVKDLDGLGHKVYALDQAPQLGSHPYGQTVASHDQKSATEASGSARAVLNQLREVATQADQALARAAGLYTGTEDDAFSALKTKQA
ncbi:hypothetical protein [Amycolatopsis vancoresmycina]|uniref:Uncharacterized protein n=1 Tax=Amycolatopsis vancoresmycina DSM 44592 TaxID=1292037 RepID=R1G6R0_9PSEU|nr:hypothetical protein [Amycolatopsis vancoresmycina]EOD67152.1 hypothetical protein H480_17857 [Amycolatopsis vancoresmycina DSM 44592]